MPNTIDTSQNLSLTAGLQANAPMLRLFIAQAMAASFVSSPVDLSACNSSTDPSLEFQCVGTGTGTFAWETSNSYDPGSNPGATFFVVADAQTSPSLAGAAPAGANKAYLGALLRAAIGTAKWARLRYTAVSGTGTCDAWLYLRGVAR